MSLTLDQTRKSKGLFTGLCEMKVVAINPDVDVIKQLTGREEVSDPQYAGLTDAGEEKLRLDIYLSNEEHGINTKIVFWLENRLAVSSKGNKQFVNDVGMSTWASDEPTQAWFVLRNYRQAYVGEADLYNFLGAWTDIDKRSKQSELKLETSFSDITKGNLDELNDLITILKDRTVQVLLSVKEGKYQDVYNKVFLPMNSTYINTLKTTLERDASAGYPYKGDYQGSFEFQKYTPEAAPVENITTTANAADISALLKEAHV